MASNARNLSKADELDSTILRHSVNKYFSELQQEVSSHEYLASKRPIKMSFSTNTSSTNADSVLPKRIRFDKSAAGDNSLMGIDLSGMSSISRNANQSLPGAIMAAARQTKTAKESCCQQNEMKLAEKQAAVLELEQKLINSQMKLKELETENSRLQYHTASVEEKCRVKLKQFREQNEDLEREVAKSGLKLVELARDKAQAKAASDQLKTLASQEKLSYSQKLLAKDQELEELQTSYEDEMQELRQKLEHVTWELNNYKLQAEEADKKLLMLEKVDTSNDHEATIKHQRQVIMEMENALFAQLAAFSK